MKGKEKPHPFLEGMAFMGLMAVAIIVYFFFAPIFSKSLDREESNTTSESMMYADEGEYYNNNADIIDTATEDVYPAP